MYSQSNWMIFFLLICLNYLEADLNVISLGSDCQVAQNLKNFNLRQEAYPFDWIISEDFEAVIDVIKDDFNHWLDPNFLEYRGQCIYNNYYNIAFVHDFPIINQPGIAEGEHVGFGAIDLNYMQTLPIAQEKFERRIKRLQYLCETNSPIIFVRAHANRKSAQRFVSVIKSKYPNLPFVLIVVSRAGLLNPAWNLENVIHFYLADESGNLFPWWWNSATWHRIYQQVNLVP